MKIFPTQKKETVQENKQIVATVFIRNLVGEPVELKKDEQLNLISPNKASFPSLTKLYCSSFIQVKVKAFMHAE